MTDKITKDNIKLIRFTAHQQSRIDICNDCNIYLQAIQSNIIVWMFALFALLLSFFKEQPLPPINYCPFQICDWNSTDYMDKVQQLRKIPSFIPNFLDPPPDMQISNILFQTNEKYEVPIHMYETFMANIDLNPHFEYRFYDGVDRRKFMKEMGGDYLKVYDTLLPNAFKADVFRYTVVYRYGGCYMDAGSLGVKPLAQLLRPTDQFVSSDDTEGRGLNSAFFCAIKGSKVLEHTLGLIFESVLNHDYGNSDLNISGPFKFIQGLQKYLGDPNFTMTKPGIYQRGVRLLWRNYTIPCLIAQIQDEKQIYVISKYPAYVGDMKRYTGRQRYGVDWKQKLVYVNDTATTKTTVSQSSSNSQKSSLSSSSQNSQEKKEQN